MTPLYKFTAISWRGHTSYVYTRRGPKSLKYSYPGTAWVVFDRHKVPPFSPDWFIRQNMEAGPFETSEECNQWVAKRQKEHDEVALTAVRNAARGESA